MHAMRENIKFYMLFLLKQLWISKRITSISKVRDHTPVLIDDSSPSLIACVQYTWNCANLV